MPRDRFRDDNREDYDEQPRRKSGGNKGLIIGLAVGGGLLLICLAASLVPVFLLGWRGAAAPAPVIAPAPVVIADPAADAKKAPMGKGIEAARQPKEVKVYTRDEFTTLVTGKTMDEVKALLGNPTVTKAAGPNADPTWSYNGVTIDPDTGKVDRTALLVFRDGKVFSVMFLPPWGPTTRNSIEVGRGQAIAEHHSDVSLVLGGSRTPL
jgi:hypothetical protein